MKPQSRTFESKLWAATSSLGGIDAISPELEPLLRRCYELINVERPDLTELKKALVRLLAFICSENGRTHENCTATDLFFCITDDWDHDWGDLPQDFVDVIGHIAGALHDTVKAPKIADNFDSTPEQLLERALKLSV